MSTTGKEQEAKFFISDISGLKSKLESLRAPVVVPRIHEFNWRYDLPDGSLKETFQILRIRQDSAVHLTYKGPQEWMDGIPVRPEHEMVVSELAAAQAILASLGYGVTQVYEKYRTVFQLGEVQVMLDEMPYGIFCELEADSSSAIREAAKKLGLKLENQARRNYLRIYDDLAEKLDLDLDGLTFKAFEGLEISAEMLGLHLGDG